MLYLLKTEEILNSHICAIFNIPEYLGPVIAIYENCAVKDVIKILDNYEIQDNMIEIAELNFINNNKNDRDILIKTITCIELDSLNVQDLYLTQQLEMFLNELYYNCITKESNKILH